MNDGAMILQLFGAVAIYALVTALFISLRLDQILGNIFEELSDFFTEDDESEKAEVKRQKSEREREYCKTCNKHKCIAIESNEIMTICPGCGNARRFKSINFNKK